MNSKLFLIIFVTILVLGWIFDQVFLEDLPPIKTDVSSVVPLDLNDVLAAVLSLDSSQIDIQLDIDGFVICSER